MLANGILRAALAASALALVAASAPAQSCESIDRLAGRLEHQARHFQHEVDEHFRPCPQYVALDRNGHEIERLACHIRGDIARGASPWHLRHDIDRLDQLVHYTRSEVEALGAWHQLDHRSYRHLQRSLAEVDDTVHGMQDELRVLTPVRPLPYPTGPFYRPQVQVPYYYPRRP